MKKITESNEELFIQLANGDKSAREKIIIKNLAYVNFIFNKEIIKHKKYDRDDYFQIGVIGLIKAVDTYKIGKCKFTSYSYRCIVNEMYMAARKENKKKEVSLDAPMLTFKGDDRVDTFVDRLQSSDDLQASIEEQEQKDEVRAFIKTKLPSLQSEILQRRYYSGDKVLTQLQVSQELNITQSYLCKQEKSAIKAIKVAFAGEY